LSCFVLFVIVCFVLVLYCFEKNAARSDIVVSKNQCLWATMKSN
jgi:hypothetical protein